MSKKTTTAVQAPPDIDPIVDLSNPAGEYDWSKHQGPSGMDNVTPEEMAIPFLSICQKGSAEYDKDHQDYDAKRIEGIETGDIFNSATREIVYKEGSDRPLFVIPCYRVRIWQEWKPRSSGGGFVKTHSNQSDLIGRTGDQTDKDGARKVLILSGDGVGNEIKETVSWACLAFISGAWTTVIINMQSSNLTPARQWTTRAMSIRKKGPDGKEFAPALYSHAYALSTVLKTGKKGNYYVFQVVLHGGVANPGVVRQALGLSTTFSQDVNKLLAPASKEAAETKGVDEDGNPY